MKVIKFCFFFLMCSGILRGQDLEKELDLVLRAYNQPQYLSMNVVVTCLMNDGKKSIPLGKSVIKRSKLGYYSKFTSDETIANDKHALVIDHDTQEMIFFEHPLSNSPAANFGLKIDSIICHSDSTVRISSRGNIQVVRCYVNRGLVNFVDLHYAQRDYFIRKIEYNYLPTEKSLKEDSLSSMLLEYRNISVKPFNEEKFSTLKYISINEKGVETTPDYDHYKLTVVR